jgi:hypothetical protein
MAIGMLPFVLKYIKVFEAFRKGLEMPLSPEASRSTARKWRIDWKTSYLNTWIYG